MANLSKIKRDNMIAFLEELKKEHSDDASIRAFNEIENHLRDKKYGLIWEEHSEAVDEMLEENIPVLTADPERRLCKDETLPWNFIIEGDNLQALYLLEKTHKGKVDCIYIDPPYNTGARDWKYNNDYVDGNDVYRHSKWLSMMKNRLHLAKTLLNPIDSVLVVTIDEKEYLHLGCLLEELFPTSEIQMVTSVINPKGSARSGRFSRVEEYIFFVYIGKAEVIPTSNDMLRENTGEKREVRWAGLLRNGEGSARARIPSLFYPIFINKETGLFHSVGTPLEPSEDRHSVKCPEGTIALFPVSGSGQELMWRLYPPSFVEYYEKGYIKFGRRNVDGTRPVMYLQSGMIKKIEDGQIIVTGKTAEGALELEYADSQGTRKPATVWNMVSHSASEHGSSFIKQLLPSRKFTYPKSLYAVHDTIRFFVANKPNAIVVDFFAGSGTTGHAVNLLNAEDEGRRKFILITNNEISETEEKTFEKLGISKGTSQWESQGIAKNVTWPRTICSINGVDINGKTLKGEYLGSNIPMSDGFNANVKYFKCDWTPRKPEDYLLSNVLCLHIREMIELQNAIEVDNVKNVLILNKSDFRNTILNPDIYAQIEHIWVNQNIILNAEELKLLEAKGFKYIPREFFGQELKEAAE